MKKKILMFLSMAAVCVLFCLARTTDAKAEEGTGENKIYDLNITVERNYDYAKQVLELVNQERIKAGVDTVKMDEELTEAAMVRAMETTVVYAHGRTNSKPMRTLTSVIAMENAGCARSTSEEIMDAWMNSDGHKRNILDASWKSVGIGCIKYKDTYFWTQLFSEKEPTGTLKSGYTTNSETIEVASKFLHLTSKNLTSSLVKGTTSLALSQPCKNWEAFIFEPNANSFTFQSSNPCVATINSSGTISVLKDGTTTITAYYAGTQDVAYSKTINCKVGTTSTVKPSSSPSVKSTTKPDNTSVIIKPSATTKPTASPTTKPIKTNVVASSCSYTITYYCDVVFRKKNGERPTVKQVEKHTTVHKIRKPYKKGYTFLGWYTNEGKKFNFSKKIHAYTVLYAKWKRRK